MALAFGKSSFDEGHQRIRPYTREEWERKMDFWDEYFPGPPENKFERRETMSKTKSEQRLNMQIPADLRQDIQDIAYLTKDLSERELVVTALKNAIQRIKDAGGEKLENALKVIREAREL